LAGLTARVDVLLQCLEKESDMFLNSPIRDGDSTIFENVTFHTPDDKTLIKNINSKINNDESVLIMGASGCGKSSILRCISGIWPFFNGKIILPSTLYKIMYLPQEPYLPLVNLYEQIVYPEKIDNLDQFVKVDTNFLLENLNLKHILINPKCSSSKNKKWILNLSRGEKQRLVMCRLLYHKPDIAILDEPSNCVDIDNQKIFFSLCKQYNIRTITISHDPSLKVFHTKLMTIEKGDCFIQDI